MHNASCLRLQSGSLKVQQMAAQIQLNSHVFGQLTYCFGSHLCVCAQVRDARGRRVGRCKEWAKVVGDDQVDARVLAMRHKDLPYVPKLQKATKPERVMTYRSAPPAYYLVSSSTKPDYTGLSWQQHA